MAEYEVAAEFLVIDRATRVLERTLTLARDLVVEFDRLNVLGKDLFAGTGVRGFNNQLGRTDTLLSGVAKSMETASAKGVDSFNAMTEAAAKLEASIGAIRDEMVETAAAARSLRLPAAAGVGGRGGGGGGHGGGGGSGSTLLFGRGGHGGEMGSEAHKYAGYGIIGALGYGAYEEASAQTEVSRILLGAGLQVDDRVRRAEVEKVIKEISADTGVNYGEAGAALKNTVLGFPNIPFDQRIGFARSRAQYAMVEHLMKPEISLREAEEASIGLTHMAGNYTPEAMLRMQADIAAISTNTFANLATVERAASYAMPMARVAGISPETVFSIITANQLSGITNTKSGTWLGDLVTTGLNPKGGLAALISTKAGRRRAEMMERLGLMDSRGRMVGMEMLERGDLLGLQKTLAAHLANIPRAERAGDFAIAAGGVQPGRQLAQFAFESFAQLADDTMKRQHSFLAEGPAAALAKQTQFDPSLQFHRTMMDFTAALSNLGTVVLPPLTSALSSIDKTLHAIIPSLPGGDGKSVTTKDLANSGAVAGAGVGFVVGGVPGAMMGAVAGYGGGLATGGALETAKLGVDPSTGMPLFVGGATDHATAASHGFGTLGTWFDRTFLGGSSGVGATDDHAGADKVTQAVDKSGDKVGERVQVGSNQIVAAIMSLATSLPAGIRGAIGSAITSEAGKPPTDAGHVDSRVIPLFPANTF